MKSLFPKSIVARTVWVLSIGFVLIIIDAAIISALIFRAESKPTNMYEIGISIKTLAALVSNTPMESREQLIRYYENPNLTMKWHGYTQPQPRNDEHWGTQRFQQHLLEHLNNPNIQQVLIRHFHDDQTSNLFVILQLTDQSWLEFGAKTPNHHTQWLFTAILILLCFFLGIYVLALLISRQIVTPIRHFTEAAMQFSTDINAPPLQSCGASEVNQAVNAFNVMQERIRRFVTERLEISAAISHDLRTPLTRLRLRLETLDDPVQQKKCLQDIDEMQSMLQSTLAFARDDTDKEPKTLVDFASLLQSICNDFADSGAEVSYTGPEHLKIQCRPAAIKRAINNLIDNAIKYGQMARLSLQPTPQQIEIRVCDAGPGIPEQEWENVFTPFYRLEKSRNRETGGTGLGLTVTRTIISSHGGHMKFCQERQQFCVLITLPL
ncbi:MAG: HAMP domain-containing histidine kinase [Gammaproteobacteria bacterium]|nr:HAMP domain-containing histidine kinase [Gammaproteobacteria bacterium]MDH5799467.1 HAMP domain-containing histidine kinase [Gammaproteobacteria bacterium]